MAYNGPGRSPTSSSFGGLQPDGADPAYGQSGYKRKKLSSFLKAANEVRQSYFAGDENAREHGSDYGPGAFPDAAIARSGNEEMILFPSYARRHVKSKVRLHA